MERTRELYLQNRNVLVFSNLRFENTPASTESYADHFDSVTHRYWSPYTFL